MFITQRIHDEYNPKILEVRRWGLIYYTDFFYRTSFVSFFDVGRGHTFGNNQHFTLQSPSNSSRKSVFLAHYLENSLIVPRQELSSSWTLRSVFQNGPEPVDFPSVICAHQMISASSYPGSPLDFDLDIPITAEEYYQLLPYHIVNSIKYCLYRIRETNWNNINVWEFLDVVVQLSEEIDEEVLSDAISEVKRCRDNLNFDLSHKDFIDSLIVDVDHLHALGY